MLRAINIRLDAELWRNVKVEAARQGVSVRQLVTSVLERHLTLASAQRDVAK